MENTLVIIKPDGVERYIIGKLIGRFESEQLKIINMRMLTMSREIAEAHYAEHRGKHFYGELIEYIISGPSVALILEGENAISHVRTLNEALREEYRVDATKNTVHGSDSKESAAREIKLFFGSSSV